MFLGCLLLNPQKCPKQSKLLLAFLLAFFPPDTKSLERFIIHMENLSLFKLGRSGRWFIQYYSEDGRRRQKTTGCTNKAEAMKVLMKFAKGMADERKPKRAFLSSFTHDFLRYASTNYATHTLYLYMRTLNHFTRICGDVLLNSLSAKHFDMFKVTRLNEYVQGKISKKCQGPR